MMVVLRAKREDMYQGIKQLTLVQFGVPSQVVTQRVIGDPKKSMSVATKVTIQVAAKLGAEPWQLKMPTNVSSLFYVYNANLILLLFCWKNFMVCGYDTYHDAKQSKAVGAFVASVNPAFTRFFSSVEAHQNNEEISPSFHQHMLNALKAFYQVNKCLPSKVIVYRDGIGAGDIARLKETEIAAVKVNCFPVNLFYCVTN